MHKGTCIICTSVAAPWLASMAFAQGATSVNNAEAQATEIARQQQEANAQLRAQSLSALAAPPDGEAAPQTASQTDIAAVGPCFVIGDVDVSGVQLLPQHVLDTAYSEFLNTCLQLGDLDQIIRNITHLYTDRGYITARAFLREQVLLDGTLEVAVVEGQLDKIVIDGAPGEHRTEIATAFPGMVGKPVNLREIEQGLDQLNRLNGVNATMEIAAGEGQGTSELAVSRNLSSPLSTRLTVDNHGSKSTGRDQASLALSYANPLGLNDQVGLTLSRGSIANPLGFSDGGPRSDTFAISYSVPYGRYTLSFNSSLNDYRSEVPGAVATVLTRGNSRSHSLTFGALIYRDQVAKTSANFVVSTSDAKNYVSNTLLQSSSFRSSNAELSLSHSHRFGQAATSVSLSYGFGVPWFNGRTDAANSAATDPKAQFERFKLSASYQRPFEMKGYEFAFSSALTAQWAPHNLHGGQQLSLGGRSSIRGFRDSVAAGNVGGHLRNEFSMTVPVPEANFLAGMASKMSPYVALDMGRIARQSEYGIAQQDLVGGAYGLRIKGDHVNFEISRGAIFKAPDAVNRSDHEYTVVSFTTTF